jgi:hypothetical protein
VSPIANTPASYINALNERVMGTVVRSEVVQGLPQVVYVIRTRGGHEVRILAQDVTLEKPAKKPVRSINRKLNDIAEAAWAHGDGASREDHDYGCIGDVAERRVDRLRRQVETLAVMAIIGLHREVTIAAINTCPRRDELLASALVGDWDRVNQLIGHLKANTTAPLTSDLADPLTGATIRLEERNPASLLNFPCCGGLRPAHTSTCREA